MYDDLDGLGLDAAQLRFATWRTPRPLPAPAPFDLDAALVRLGTLVKGTRDRELPWGRVGVTPVLGEDAARFWYAAMRLVDTHGVKTAKKLLGESIPPFDAEEHATLVNAFAAFDTPEAVYATVPLQGLDALVTWFAAPPEPRNRYQVAKRPLLAPGLLPWVPELTPTQRTRLEARATQAVSQAQPPFSDRYHVPDGGWFLAAVLSQSAAIAPLFAALPDRHFGMDDWHDHYNRPFSLLLGVGDPERFVHTFRRLRIPLRRRWQARALLANTGVAGLELVLDAVRTAGNRVEAEAIASALLPVSRPEIAPAMLRLVFESRAATVGRHWLRTHPDVAAEGLAPLLGSHLPIADDARAFLRQHARNGGRPALQALADRLEGAAGGHLARQVLDHGRDRVTMTEDTAPDWLTAGIASFPKKERPPTWLTPRELPQLLVDGKPLSDALTRQVLRALRASTFPTRHDLVSEIRTHADPDSRDAFAWGCFTAWMAEGAPSKERWALDTLGHLGGDRSASRLAPMVRVWPGQSQHKRATAGIDALAGIGTDNALMRINGISQKLKFKALKEYARLAMLDIATRRGLSPDELADRILPDCGLDADGRRVFDYGPRQFTLVLTDDVKVAARDAAGKVRANLPKPNSKDDPELAAQSRAAWKQCKKQLTDMLKIERVRLERAMVTGRRWRAADFQRFLVAHPVLRHVLRRLVWAVEEAGQLVHTFRIDETNAWVDLEDDPVAVDPEASVVLPHPLRLGDALATAWGEVLADYEIVSPFEQLGRAVLGLTPDEAAATVLTRFARTPLSAGRLVGNLERAGWTRGPAQDAGGFSEHYRYFEGPDLTASVRYEGIPMGYIGDWEDQHLESVVFVPGRYTGDWYPEHADRLVLGAVDAVAMSEVLADLTDLTT